MRLPCVDADWGMGSLCVGVPVSVRGGLAGRCDYRDVGPLLVTDEVGKGVVGVEEPSRGVVSHLRDVVNVLGPCDGVCVDR